jgi:hypothetical protein
MFNVLVGLFGIVILLISSWQALLTFRADSFHARGNGLIRRSRHPLMFWMNVAGLAGLAVIGVALICWSIFLV